MTEKLDRLILAKMVRLCNEDPLRIWDVGFTPRAKAPTPFPRRLGTPPRAGAPTPSARGLATPPRAGGGENETILNNEGCFHDTKKERKIKS